MRLDNLELVEADAVAGGGDEAVVGGVLRRREDGAETLLGCALAGRIELQFVEALLIVDDRAARAENLHGDAALAAPGRTIKRHDAGDAAVDFEQDAGDVEGFYRPPPAAAQWPVGIGLREVRHDALHV